MDRAKDKINPLVFNWRGRHLYEPAHGFWVDTEIDMDVYRCITLSAKKA